MRPERASANPEELLVGTLGQLVVRDREPTGVGDLLDLVGHARRALRLHVVTPEGPERLHEPARRLDLEVLALAERTGRAGVRHDVARAGRPVRLDGAAEGVTRALRGVGERLPEPLGRGLDVDLEHLLHGSVLESRLEPRERCRPGSAYLLTHRSWTSRIGTEFRKWSFSRPRRLVMTRPASSSTRRCFMTPKRVIGNRCSSEPRVCPSCSNSASSRERRVGSASALNTSSTP